MNLSDEVHLFLLLELWEVRSKSKSEELQRGVEVDSVAIEQRKEQKIAEIEAGVGVVEKQKLRVETTKR